MLFILKSFVIFINFVLGCAKLSSAMEIERAAELNDLGLDLDFQVIEERDGDWPTLAIWLLHLKLRSLLLDIRDYLGAPALTVGLGCGWILGHEPFYAILLYLDIDACLSDSHDDTADELLPGVWLRFEELEGVELHTGLGGKLGHSVLAIHLIALLGELELVGHVVA